MYKIVTFIQVKRVAEKKRIAFKDCFNFFSYSLNLVLGKL